MKKNMLTNGTVPFSPSLGIGRNAARANFFRNILLQRLDCIHHGKIEIHDQNNTFQLGTECDNGLQAVIRVNDPSFYPAVVFGGSVGAGESYMRGEWTCDDLTNLVRIIIKSRDVLISLDSGLAKVTAPLYKIFHARRKNTTEGSKKNIRAHYDLGNEFYSLFLDETMAYSCGIFKSTETTLKEASVEKFDRICRKLRLTPDDHLLEIGAGWGGFAIFAAVHYGCRVTTTTISQNQYELTRQKITKAGLSDRITLLREDYRELRGKFDKLISIEMIEAVGHHFFKEFFYCCSKLLKPTGLMLLQAITITDQIYETHKNSVDFIKRYIFPGSCIPSITAMLSAATSASDLKLFHLEDISPHYAKTLRAWRQNFFKNVFEVRKQGFSESFIKMWEFYLCYCEAGFAERYLGDVQMILTKPACRHDPIIPTLCN